MRFGYRWLHRAPYGCIQMHTDGFANCFNWFPVILADCHWFQQDLKTSGDTSPHWGTIPCTSSNEKNRWRMTGTLPPARWSVWGSWWFRVWEGHDIQSPCRLPIGSEQTFSYVLTTATLWEAKGMPSDKSIAVRVRKKSVDSDWGWVNLPWYKAVEFADCSP